MAVCGAFCFYFLQLYDKGFAYQWTITPVIFMGALLLEVPTTQQRFLNLIIDEENETIQLKDTEEYIRAIAISPINIFNQRLNLILPVKEWSSVAEVGMYNSFGEWSMHYGMDIAVTTGTKLYVATDVTVEVVYYSEVGGNTLMMRNGSLVIIYCHMRELFFRKVGERVKAGELVGYSGAAENVTGPHMHMETWSTDIDNVRNGFSIQKEIFFNPRLLWDFRK